MEGLGSQSAKCAQILALVLAEQAVRVVLDNRNLMVTGNLFDGTHLTTHTCVMYRDNRFGARRNCRLNAGFVQV